MPTRKRYKVVGAAPVHGHQPGETFEADLSDSEAFLIAIGAIRVEGISGDELKSHKGRGLNTATKVADERRRP